MLFHDQSRRLSLVYESSHLLHGRVDVIEELAIAGAKKIQTICTVRRLQKTVLRTFSVARVTNLAVQTVLRQSLKLGVAKLLLAT